MAIAGKENENGVYEFPYMIKPPQRTKWETIKISVWDPSTKEFLGRNAKSWVQILLFYTIFYIVLAALFAICMAALYSTLDKDKPTYTDLRSLIGSNPGLGFRPIADTSEGALIWYNANNKTNREKYIHLINDFLKEYNNTKPGPDSKFSPSCSFDENPTNGKACPVSILKFDDCNGPNYGYDTPSPCVFLKLNKIYDWLPETYDFSDPLPKEMPDKLKTQIKLVMHSDRVRVYDWLRKSYDWISKNPDSQDILPKDMPEKLKNETTMLGDKDKTKIQNWIREIYKWIPEEPNATDTLPQEMPGKLKEQLYILLNANRAKSDQVWVSCEGEYPADKEHVTEFRYFPSQGFPSYYYPFKHKKGEYLSPLVAVRLINPKRGVLINVECRVWAKNIVYSGGAPEQRKGSVHFEIMRDE